MNKNIMTAMIFGLLMVMGVVIVRAEECPPPQDPPTPPAGEGQVKASPTPVPSATPAAGVVR